MPYYEISHCVPLSRAQKDAIAEFITDLHATTFTTPRIFVNVVFDPAPQRGDIYAGAKHRGQTAPNSIRSFIRVGPTRPREMYEQLGLKVQKYWHEVVSDSSLGAQSFDGLSTEKQSQIKHLKGIVFFPFTAAVEDGLVVPPAGGDTAWLKEHMSYFREQLEKTGNSDIREMLHELEHRDDMKAILAADARA